MLTVDNMKRSDFRAAYLSTDKNAEARTKLPQTTELQLFYIMCCKQLYFKLSIASLIRFSSILRPVPYLNLPKPNYGLVKRLSLLPTFVQWVVN